MKSRVQPAIARLFDTPGFKGTKHEVCAAVPCDPKTAARYLCDLWMNNNIYITGWVRGHGSPLPVYAKRVGAQQDAPRPRAKKDIPFLERGVDEIYAQRRERKKRKDSLANTPTMGFWGI